MKKLLRNLLLLLLSCYTLTGCTKDIFGSTYTVTASYEFTNVVSNMEMRFYEYNENNEMINYHIWENIPLNGTKKFKAHELAVKVVVYVHADTSYGEWIRYVSQIFYLSDRNTKINLDGDTLVSKVSPI